MGLRPEVLEGHRVADLHRDLGARHEVRPLGVGVEQLVGSPLPHRDHRAPRLEGDPGGAGLADHRPQVGVAGQRALGIDHDALARLDRRDGGVEGTLGVLGEPLDRDLPGRAQEEAERAVLEEARLGEVPRHPSVVVDDVRGGERVDVRDVVEDQDAATGRRDLLAVDPRTTGGGEQAGLEDGHRQADGPPALLLLRAHGSHRHLASSTLSCTGRPAPAPVCGGQATRSRPRDVVLTGSTR